MTIARQDTFASRTVATGFGTASDGNVWATQSGDGQSVSSNEAHIAGSTASAFMTLGASLATADGNALTRFQAQDNTNTLGILLRWTDANNYYLARSDGAGHIAFFRNVAGTKSTVGTYAFTPNTALWYWMRFQVQGSTISIRTWQDGTGEPGTWNYTTTDTSLAGTGGSANRVGLYGFSNSGPDLFDHFSVDDLQSGGTPLHLSGTIPSAQNLAATLLVQRNLAASVPSGQNVAGSLQISRALAGSLPTAQGLASTLQISRTLSGALPSAQGLGGSLQITRALAGSLPSAQALAGALTLVRHLSGALPSGQGLAATLSVGSSAVHLSGVLPSGASLSAALQIRRHLAALLPSGQGLSGSLQTGPAVALLALALSDSALAQLVFSDAQIASLTQNDTALALLLLSTQAGV